MSKINVTTLSVNELVALIAAASSELADRASGKTIAAADNKPAAAPKGRHVLTDEDRAKAAEVRAAKKAAKLSAPIGTRVGVRNVAASGFRVRKPDGSLCHKMFTSHAECAAWLASWVNKAHASKYSVVAAS